VPLSSGSSSLDGVRVPDLRCLLHPEEEEEEEEEAEDITFLRYAGTC